MPSTKISSSHELAGVVHAFPLVALYGYKQEEIEAVVSAHLGDWLSTRNSQFTSGYSV